MKHENSTFLCGSPAGDNLLYFAKEVDELAAEDTPNSTFFSVDHGGKELHYQRLPESVGWPAISMAVGPGGTVIATGPNGDLWEYDVRSGAVHIGRMTKGHVNIRKLALIDSVVHACGMGRVVLRRDGRDEWKSIGPGERKGDPDVVGFEDIAAYNADEVYAVGWGGEIWWRVKGKWRRIDSPTSMNLRALHCAEDAVYAVGHEGTMVRGRHDAWEIVETGRDENLMDVATFDGQLYVVTDFRILKLTEKGLVNDTQFSPPRERQSSCLYLLPSENTLISLGLKQVFKRTVGKPWKRLV